MATNTSDESYLPALRFRALTPLFDGVVRWTMRERTFKARLLAQADLQRGHSVLDLGCGTGTLALMAKAHEPDAELIGLDADPEILVRARKKAVKDAVEIRFDEALSTEMPYEDQSFDRVLSTLFFHHLTTADKRRTSEEIARVLRPGGELHVADFGRPQDRLMALLIVQVRLFDGFEPTRDNVRGLLTSTFAAAGLVDVVERERLRTLLGTLSLYRARKPSR
jgi:ubiquinone/menaquinone biosynthesis C-methylase UbiE